MSDNTAENMTHVTGYFNPQKYPIFIEISEINLKAELAPGAYIRDRNGQHINDPIFEQYCHQKGLSRSTGKSQVPIRYVPRLVKTVRPHASVTQATGFTREPGGRTVPTFPASTAPPRTVPTNKTPITGMTMEAARKMGLVGKPRLLPEDYGGTETSGAPSKGGAIPPIRYSIESAPRIRSSAPLRPELTEADVDLPPDEKARRTELQRSLNTASAAPSGDTFDPARVRPLTPVAPVPLRAPEDPTPIVAESAPAPAPAAVKPKAKTAKKRIAAPVVEAPPSPVRPVPVKPVAVRPVAVKTVAEIEAETEPEQSEEPVEPGSGIIQPLDESATESPVADSPPGDESSGKNFVCAADGRPFKFRSELERHVKRNFPEMEEELMAAYPPT